MLRLNEKRSGEANGIALPFRARPPIFMVHGSGSETVRERMQATIGGRIDAAAHLATISHRWP